MSRKKTAIREQILPVLIAAVLTFLATNYWNGQKAEETLREKRLSVLDDLVTMSSTMANTVKFMSVLSCEFGNRRLSIPEQNQRTIDLNRMIVEAQDKIERLNNRLTIYFPDTAVRSDFERVKVRYASALNEHQTQLNKATAGGGCHDASRVALLDRHIQSMSSALGALSGHMVGFLGISEVVVAK